MNPLIIENGAFKKIPQKVKTLGVRFAIVTDQNLRERGEELLHAMRAAKLSTSLLLIGAGETSKNLATYEKLVNALIKLGFKRDGCLIALGGGVVGDITGFVASTYMRGISFVQVPTTLLAMSDSSLGGKTGIDLPEGKNLLGTFYPAHLTVMDPLLLKTLPDREFKSGLAEIVKHGIIAKKVFFEFLEKNAAAILKRSPTILKKMIRTSAEIKMSIVQKDTHESLAKKDRGVSRMLLNYGHTVGHALEKLSEYTLPHGEAVAIGMVAENRIAVGKKTLKESDAVRIEGLLKRLGLPTKIPPRFTPADIKKALSTDKKHVGGKLYFALPTRIGGARTVTFETL